MWKTSSETIFHDFFRPSKQKLWKNPHFLTSPRCNSAPPRGPKPCKKRCFWTPGAKYTVNYRDSCRHAHPTAGRRQGRQASVTFGYHRRPPAMPRARGRRPDWSRYIPTTDLPPRLHGFSWVHEVHLALLAWKDYLQQLSSDSSKRFDAVWLGFLAATSDLFLLLLDTGNQGLSGIVLAEGKSIYSIGELPQVEIPQPVFLVQGHHGICSALCLQS